MKKKIALILVCLLLSCCAIPFSSIAIVTITVEDQFNHPIKDNVTVYFFDSKDQEITNITLDDPSSFGNNIHWLARSYHKTKDKNLEDVKRVRSVLVKANDCSSLSLPFELSMKYEPVSFAPHGGGFAYLMYRFEPTVNLVCDKVTNKKDM